MSELTFRAGGRADRTAILGLWDGAVAWLVARGQTGQWGREPASRRSSAVAGLEVWLAAADVTIAERDGVPAGVSVLTSVKPSHVAPAERPETYLMFLLSSREHAGQGIGAALVRLAVEQARANGSELLRVDCWAGAPRLVAWYEAQGFVRSGTFDVDGWPGQVFEMEL